MDSAESDSAQVALVPGKSPNYSGTGRVKDVRKLLAMRNKAVKRPKSHIQRKQEFIAKVLGTSSTLSESSSDESDATQVIATSTSKKEKRLPNPTKISCGSKQQSQLEIELKERRRERNRRKREKRREIIKQKRKLRGKLAKQLLREYLQKGNKPN